MLYQQQVTDWHAANPNGRSDEHRPYPLTLGTAPVATGECWKCGMADPRHRGDECTGQAVPDNERRWCMIASTISRPALPTAIWYIYIQPEYYDPHEHEPHDNMRWREAMDEAGNGDGPAA